MFGITSSHRPDKKRDYITPVWIVLTNGETCQLVDYLPQQQKVPSLNLGLTTIFAIFPFFSICRNFSIEITCIVCKLCYADMPIFNSNWNTISAIFISA